MTAAYLAVSSYQHAQGFVKEHDPTFVLSIVDPGSSNIITPGPACRAHEVLHCHDVTRDFAGAPADIVLPSLDDAAAIAELASRWAGRGTFLIHCFAGVSRSAAAGLIALATIRPDEIRELALQMHAAGPWVWPNEILIEHGDHALEMRGRLIGAVLAMGSNTMIGVPKPLVMEIE